LTLTIDEVRKGSGREGINAMNAGGG